MNKTGASNVGAAGSSNDFASTNNERSRYAQAQSSHMAFGGHGHHSSSFDGAGQSGGYHNVDGFTSPYGGHNGSVGGFF